MSVRYVLAPQAAIDLVEIWRYIKEQSSLEIADRVETAIREKFEFLAKTPGAGHLRKDLTDADVGTRPRTVSNDVPHCYVHGTSG
jgi:plasmid stabilization system protein ParE